MGKILAGVFGFLMICGVAGMDYIMFAKRAQAAGAGAAAADYIADIQARYSSSTKQEPELDIAAFLPAAADGWERTPYAEEDGLALTGVAFDENLTDANTVNDLQRSFLESRRPSQRVSETYRKGDQMVAIRLSFVPGGKMTSFKRKMQAMEAEDALEAAMENDANYYGLIRGVLLTNLPQPAAEGATEPAYRLLTGQIGEDVSLMVLTNADDDHLRAIIGRIDTPGLNALLAQPLATVAAENPVLWQAEAHAAYGAQLTQQATPPVAADVSEAAAPTETEEKPQTCIRRAGVKTCS